MGTLGNTSSYGGNPTVVQIDSRQWSALENILRLQENEVDKMDGLVDARVVMDELGIGKKRLCNLISEGKISRDMYTVAANGVKKFFIKKILGLEEVNSSRS